MVTSSSFASLVTICRERNIPWSRFGRDATGDPRLIFDLRNGRGMRPALAKRITAYVASLEGC